MTCVLEIKLMRVLISRHGSTERKGARVELILVGL
jgi:hypothetical protein